MKTHIRLIALVLAFLLALPLFGSSAIAADVSTGDLGANMTQTLLESTAIEYVDRYVQTAFCYGEEDFTEKTLLAIVEESKLSRTAMDTTTLTLQGTAHTLTDLSGNLQQFGAVAEFYKTTRQANGITRHNFDVEYMVIESAVNDITAYVKLYSLVTFQYEVDGEQAVFGDHYVVHFAKYNNQWCIANVEAEEFDAYGLTKEEFDCAEATERFMAAKQLQGLQEEVGAQLIFEPSTNRSLVESISYNRGNAAAYAYTYTTQAVNDIEDPVEQRLDYYSSFSAFFNSNFNNYTFDGGNCQNFASQCVWAGFGGNDHPDYIKHDKYPMDSNGKNLADGYADDYRLKWYYDPSDGRANWTAPADFNLYIRKSNQMGSGGHNSFTTGITASMYTVPANSTTFGSTVTATSLIGGILHVNNQNHAVVITGADSTNFSDVTICENSPMRKAVSLGDETTYPNNVMELILPEKFNIATSCASHLYASYSTSIAPSGQGSVCLLCGYKSLEVHGLMIKPIPQGTRKTISASANRLCYRISIGVTAPDPNNPGSYLTTTWTQSSNVRSFSSAYTFSTPGLYIITITAHDISITNSDYYVARHVFKVRVY